MTTTEFIEYGDEQYGDADPFITDEFPYGEVWTPADHADRQAAAAFYFERVTA